MRIWDVRTGELLERLREHREAVYSVAFTPDARGLVSGSLDKTLKYWDVTRLTSGAGNGRPNSPVQSSGARIDSINGGKKDGSRSSCTMKGHKVRPYMILTATFEPNLIVGLRVIRRCVPRWQMGR